MVVGEGILVAQLPAGTELDPHLLAQSCLRAISTDMTGGYPASAGNHARQAVICIDRYVMTQLAN